MVKVSASKTIEPHIRTLIIDNYDSYTFNLFQFCLAQPQALTPIVIRNNQYSYETVRDLFVPYFDNIIISPGPGRPDKLSVCYIFCVINHFLLLGFRNL